MSTTDLVLRFELSSNPNADARTLQVLQIVDSNTSAVALYKVRASSTHRPQQLRIQRPRSFTIRIRA